MITSETQEVIVSIIHVEKKQRKKNYIYNPFTLR